MHEHGIHGLLGFGHSLRNHHTLACCKPICLDHNRRALQSISQRLSLALCVLQHKVKLLWICSWGVCVVQTMQTSGRRRRPLAGFATCCRM